MKILDIFMTDLASLAFTLVGAAILYLVRSRTKLVWAMSHQFTYLLKNQTPTPASPPAQNSSTAITMLVHTASVFIQNVGRLPATEVEITFNFPPQNHNIWPVRPYETHTSPDSRFTLKFANLAPKEQFQVELLSIPQLPAVVGIRSKEVVAKKIEMRPFQVFKPWVYVILWTLIIFGVAFVVETLARVIFLSRIYNS